jgi:hypothetical protein
MHYANGKEAKVGDKVVGKDVNGYPISGIVYDVLAQSDTCNLYIVPVHTPSVIATASQCLLADDIAGLNHNT